MFDEVIVAVDGSYESSIGLGPAAALGRHLGLRVRVVAYHDHEQSISEFRFTRTVRKQVRRQLFDEVEVQISPASNAVADQLLKCLGDSPNALLVMTTRGRGRSAGVLGSVATEVVAAAPRPILMVGPAYKSARFRADGLLVVPALANRSPDGSFPGGFDWLKMFDYEPSVIEVKKPGTSAAAGADADGLVDTLELQSSRLVPVTVVHSLRVGHAIAGYANEHRACLIVMTTRAAMGLERIAVGSIMADVLVAAECPVLTSVA